jgi:hypothetical protein
MIDETDDFGFSAVSEKELKEREQALITQQTNKLDEMSTYKQKYETLYGMVMPLLKNLARDGDDKEYIHWPGRQKKMKEFITKVEKVNG